MTPGGAKAPSGALAKGIDAAFGSFDDFKGKLQGTAAGQFGSGWGWLCVDAKGALVSLSTANQVNFSSIGIDDSAIQHKDFYPAEGTFEAIPADGKFTDTNADVKPADMSLVDLVSMQVTIN